MAVLCGSFFQGKFKKGLFSLENLFPPCQLNTAVCALSQNVKRVVENADSFHEFSVDNVLKNGPVDIFVVLKDSELQSLLDDSVPDAESSKFLEKITGDSFESGRAIKDIDFPSYICEIREPFSEELSGVFLELDFKDSPTVDLNHSNFHQTINYSHEIFLCE